MQKCPPEAEGRASVQAAEDHEPLLLATRTTRRDEGQIARPQSIESRSQHDPRARRGVRLIGARGDRQRGQPENRRGRD